MRFPHCHFVFLFAAAGLGGFTTDVSAQGCIPGYFMNLSLGPDGITRLHQGEWNVGVSYRYLYADEGWRGTERWPEYATVTGNQITIHSYDLQTTYAFNSRYSATLTLPYKIAQTSNFQPSYVSEPAQIRRVARVRGVGDLRLTGSAWLLNPATNENGNVSVSLGLKLPTGNEAATAFYHDGSGPQVRPVDVSIQLGDGGWGAIVELAGYRKIAGTLYGYANGYYLFNPREINGASSPTPNGFLPHSVTDQYLGRAGLSLANWPWNGLTLSFGGRLNGVPAHDAIGGNAGFRRPGYVMYVEPGISWTAGRNTFTLFIPTRIEANRTNNIYDDLSGRSGGGAFARQLIVTSWSRRF